jgi:hypothetical protein
LRHDAEGGVHDNRKIADDHRASGGGGYRKLCFDRVDPMNGPSGPGRPQTESEKLRAQLEAMTAEEIEHALIRRAYGPSDTWKARIAQSVLLAKRQQERQCREEDEEKRREASEVSALKREIARLRVEARATSQQLFIARLGLAVTAFALLVAYKESLWRVLNAAAALVTR